MGGVGPPWPFPASAVLQAVILWILLRKKIGSLHEQRTLISLIKISFAALVSAIIVQWLKTPIASIVDMTRFWGIFTQGVLAGIAGIIVYGFICYLLRSEEMLTVHGSLKRRFMRMANVPQEIPSVDIK